MKRIISGKTILLNTATNCTFIAGDMEASIPNYLDRPNDKHIEWAGELSVGVTEKEYRKIAEDLWRLLDDIDSAADKFKPMKENDGFESFYRYVMAKQAQKNEMLIANGDKLEIHPTYPMI